jgi:hypothetical protein
MLEKWNISQVLCWIVTRNLSKVEPKWHGQYIAAIRYTADSKQNEVFKKTGKNAPELLLQKLQENIIMVRGRKNGSGDLQDIPAVLWEDLKLDLLTFRAVPDFGAGGTYWTSLCFYKEEVLREFQVDGRAGSNIKRPNNRPNLTNTIHMEYERRRDNNELCGDWHKECDGLFAWGNRNRPPKTKQLTDKKTIRTRVVKQQDYLQDYEIQKQRKGSEKQKSMGDKL